MRWMLGQVAVALLVVTPALHGQSAETFKGMAFRGIAPSLTTGRVADAHRHPTAASRAPPRRRPTNRATGPGPVALGQPVGGESPLVESPLLRRQQAVSQRLGDPQTILVTELQW